MKIPAIVPSALCIVAGALLAGESYRQYLNGDKLDIFFIGVGLYFIGKGVFIHQILTIAEALRDKR